MSQVQIAGPVGPAMTRLRELLLAGVSLHIEPLEFDDGPDDDRIERPGLLDEVEIDPLLRCGCVNDVGPCMRRATGEDLRCRVCRVDDCGAVNWSCAFSEDC